MWPVLFDDDLCVIVKLSRKLNAKTYLTYLMQILKNPGNFFFLYLLSVTIINYVTRSQLT